MRGAVAAGHPLTAEAGARVLDAGGNAVDAAVGAALVSWVVESPLTGPGAGGFMLVHRARDCSTRVFDFFVAIPGLGLDTRELAEMDRVDVDFSGGSTQIFHIGAASCAVYEQNGERLVAGDTLIQDDLAKTLEFLAEHGADDLYRGDLARRMVEHVREQGGCFTNRDLEEFGVGEPGSAEAIDALARVMREQAQARLGRGGLARALEERAAVVSRGT